MDAVLREVKSFSVASEMRRLPQFQPVESLGCVKGAAHWGAECETCF